MPEHLTAAEIQNPGLSTSTGRPRMGSPFLPVTCAPRRDTRHNEDTRIATLEPEEANRCAARASRTER
eukprot:227181-Rhodomonas_salina.6